ncbi:hypothetical protein MTsPCn9_03960 [Croceitalea sp. MTPC9]|uniref:hypothetical protein n=1 Tax=unclassified Croceitalea TaxID=2632280 RepID=UPI002B3CCABB|nr:hypothetical protein MTsPCn6_04750 [Croceitalea sp. MTPC6]GMN15460.1 hypothetical protein MTsPCn9_03960 [Croceitalea sp. MTPC9]
MTDINPIYIIGGIIGFLAQLALLAICILLVYKRKNGATIIMLIGSILIVLSHVSNLIWPIIASRNGPENLAKSVMVLNFLGTIPYIVFTIGFGLFVIKHIKK